MSEYRYILSVSVVLLVILILIIITSIYQSGYHYTPKQYFIDTLVSEIRRGDRSVRLFFFYRENERMNTPPPSLIPEWVVCQCQNHRVFDKLTMTSKQYYTDNPCKRDSGCWLVGHLVNMTGFLTK